MLRLDCGEIKAARGTGFASGEGALGAGLVLIWNGDDTYENFIVEEELLEALSALNNMRNVFPFVLGNARVLKNCLTFI